MRILGLDPGTVTMGYGLLEAQGEEVRALESGVLEMPPRAPRPQRLLLLHRLLGELMARLAPDEAAIEDPFVGRNVRAALALGEARGIALLAAAAWGIPVQQYPPATVKNAVTGYGGGDKEQVRRMVCLQLHLSEPLPSTDATDALAVALCHLAQTRQARVLAQGR